MSLGETVTKGFVGKIAQKLTNAIFGGAINVIDTGIVAASKSLGAVTASGMAAQQYTETKKDGGFFHSDKYSDNRKDLSGEVNNQFAGSSKT